MLFAVIRSKIFLKLAISLKSSNSYGLLIFTDGDQIARESLLIVKRDEKTGLKLENE